MPISLNFSEMLLNDLKKVVSENISQYSYSIIVNDLSLINKKILGTYDFTNFEDQGS